MKTRILVTGATGLIGRQIIPMLAQAGYEVHAVVRQRPPADIVAQVSAWYPSDLIRNRSFLNLVRSVNPSGLIHLAWEARPGTINDSVHREWLSASKNLLRSFYENGGQRAVVAGTCFEYDCAEGFCSEDATPRSPNTLYGVSKNALYEFTRDFCQREDLNWCWGRVFFVYGPYEHPSRLVAEVIIRLLKNEPVDCTHGRQVRDYLHSRDVASGLMRLFGSDWVGACNIGSGRPVTLREIAETIAEKIGRRPLLRFDSRPAPEEPPVIVADMARAREVLDWKAEISLERGLQETIDHWRSELRPSSCQRL